MWGQDKWKEWVIGCFVQKSDSNDALERRDKRFEALCKYLGVEVRHNTFVIWRGTPEYEVVKKKKVK